MATEVTGASDLMAKKIVENLIWMMVIYNVINLPGS